MLASSIWGYNWSTPKVCFICDNQAVVHSIIAGTSHCPHMMHLLPNLFYIAATYNFTVSAQHLPGKVNIFADSLSLIPICRHFVHISHPSLSALRADMSQYLREALPGLINLCHIQLVFLLLHSLCHHLPLPCTRGGPPPSFREHPHAL